MINYNGAGYRPEIEDVWPVDYPTTNRVVEERRRFISEFITYARNREEVRNQALAEIEYNYEDTI